MAWLERVERAFTIVTRGGMCGGELPGPKGDPEGGARGISRGLGRYFVVRPRLVSRRSHFQSPLLANII